ncbi:MAG: hypothetical protein QM702_15560 [Rubrivivax sp.]
MSPTSAAVKVCSSRSSYSAVLRISSMTCDSSTSIATESSSTSDSVDGRAGAPALACARSASWRFSERR